MKRVRSPLVTAVATSAIARTWGGRFAASWVALFLRSFPVPAPPPTSPPPPRLAAQLPLRAHFPGHTRHFRRKGAELVEHGVHRLGGAQELAFEWSAINLQRYGL